MQIEFSEPVPKELQGKTLQECFDITRVKSKQIIQKIKEKFGNAEFTPEVEEFLSYDENMYLRLNKMFQDLSRGDTKLLTGIAK